MIWSRGFLLELKGRKELHIIHLIYQKRDMYGSNGRHAEPRTLPQGKMGQVNKFIDLFCIGKCKETIQDASE